MLFVTGPYLLTQFIGNINNFNVIYLLTNGRPASPDLVTSGGSATTTDLLITWLFNITTGATSNYKLPRDCHHDLRCCRGSFPDRLQRDPVYQK